LKRPPPRLEFVVPVFRPENIGLAFGCVESAGFAPPKRGFWPLGADPNIGLAWPLSAGGGPAGVVELLKENLGAAGVAKPTGVAAVVLGVEDPNKLVPDVLLRLGNNPPAWVVAGLVWLLAGVDTAASSFFAPPKVKPPPPRALPAPAVPNRFVVVPAELVVEAAWPNSPPAGVLPVLALAPKRLGVDDPDPALDPVFAPKLSPGCEPPVFPDPKGLAPAVAPPKRPPDAGFEVAGVDWPKIEEVEGVPLVPKRPPLLEPEVPPPPVLPKLNGPDILCGLNWAIGVGWGAYRWVGQPKLCSPLTEAKSGQDLADIVSWQVVSAPAIAKPQN
jgi:hypothetical protein